MPRRGLTRREVLAAAAAAGAAAALPPGAASAATVRRLEFAGQPDGDGWRGWTTTGVANLRRAGGQGLLEAGSDVFPNDPRPVAFALDSRFLDGEVRAVVASAGRGTGVVLRRTGPAAYYAAIYSSEAAALVLVRRDGDALTELARAHAPVAVAPLTLALDAAGANPTRLVATLADSGGRSVRVEATDHAAALQRAGDPGVLATAQTFLAQAEQAFSAFGGARLGFGGTQEGQTIAGTPAGAAYGAAVRERSTAVFRDVTISARSALSRTLPSTVAATTTLPGRRGVRLAVATDVPATVEIELSRTPGFERTRTVDAGRTGSFDAVIASVAGLTPGTRVWWRPRLRRGGTIARGPSRSFTVLPAAGDGNPVKIAVGACAAHFGPIFGQLASRAPDVFIWQGDLNYPDTHGPLAQTTTGYGGIWRDFLRNPRLAPMLDGAHFVPQRDDHDFGVQDANAEVSQPWGHAPWEALMSRAPYHRFAAGLVEVWVLDERTQKSPPSGPDSPAKTLLGTRQREWLMNGLARSIAPFKLVCSPCTLHYGGNARDGNWDAGFRAERDLLLDHIAARVSGRTLFLTGDAHDTMVYDADGVFEARACPLDIPDPRDHPGVQAGMFGGRGVAYASTASHFSLVEAQARDGRATLDLTLVDENGRDAYRRRFDEPLPRASGRTRRPSRRRRRRRRRNPPRYTG